MPQFRVIAGPYDGERWNIEHVTDREYYYTRRTPKDPIEHIYCLRLNDLTARYVKARRFEEGELED